MGRVRVSRSETATNHLACSAGSTIVRFAAADEMTKNDWDLEAANATYNIEGWGTGYFSINTDGNVVAKPLQENGGAIPILEIVDAGQAFHFGLEAGSKPELVAALAMHKDAESLVICNGYKDPAFIRIALLGRKLDKQVILVVEKLFVQFATQQGDPNKSRNLIA